MWKEDGLILWTYFGVEDLIKNWRLKRTWKKQIEEESVRVGLCRDVVVCQSMLIIGINHIAAWLR